MSINATGAVGGRSFEYPCCRKITVRRPVAAIARRDASFLKRVSKPKLLISGDRDDVSPAETIKALADKIPDPKEAVIVAGADHFFRGYEDLAADIATRFLA